MADRISGVSRPRQNYVPAFDGMRALAVLTVVASHAGVFHLPGGKAGVILFFALSGYLITSILLRERSSLGRVRFGRFYVRRFRRLYPALIIATAGYALIALYQLLHDGNRAAVPQLQSIPSALFYFENWWDIAHYHQFGIPLFNHYWSLAVEEQFYLVWPLLIALGYRVRREVGVLVIALVGVALSYAAKWTFVADAHQQQATQLAADALLIGCAIACLMVIAPRLVAFIGRWFHVPGIVLIALALYFGLSGSTATVEQSALFTRLWWACAVLGSAALVCAGATGTLLRPIAWLFTRRPIVYFGVISYGVYLFHIGALWVVSKITHYIGTDPYVGFAVAVVGTTIVAALSYRFVEAPILRWGAAPKAPTPVVDEREPATTLDRS